MTGYEELLSLNSCKVDQYTEMVSQDRIIMHVDMDCFFVAVTLLSKADLIGQPVAVTHLSANARRNDQAHSR